MSWFLCVAKCLISLLALNLGLLLSPQPAFAQTEWCATSADNLAQGFTNGTCFRYFISESLTREQAKARCASAVPGATGDLAQIPSQFAQSTLYRNLLQNMSPPRNLWIGARGYTSAEWRWSDGTPLTPQAYNNWAPGNPPPESLSGIKYCAYIEIADQRLQWRVDNCGAQKQFICEYNLARTRRTGYQFVALSYALDWYAAKVECQREGGQLLDMASPDKLEIWSNLTAQMIKSAGSIGNLAGRGAVWLGLNRQIWLWDPIDKEVAWSNFSSASLASEPVQECVYVTPDLNWVPTTCSAQMNYLCQFTITPVTTTTAGTPTTTTAAATTANAGTTTQASLTTATSATANNQTTVGPETTAATASTPKTAQPVVNPSTTAFDAQASRSNDGGISQSLLIAIIVICVVCFIVIVIAILLACCGHIWLPRIRRRIGTGGETYVVTSPASTSKLSPIQVDVGVTAHPSYQNQGTGTSHGSSGSTSVGAHSNFINVIPTIGLHAADSDQDSLDGSPPQSGRYSAHDAHSTFGKPGSIGGPAYSLDEPPNDIPEIYTSPTFLYSFPSHRPLEPVAPHRIDTGSSSGSSNVSRSPSSTNASNLTVLPPPVLPPKHLALTTPKGAASRTPSYDPKAPTPPPPFRPGSSSSRSQTPKYENPVIV